MGTGRSDLTGRQLGQYRLEAPIGDGAFGRVYRARHLGLDVARAVKVMRAGVADDPEYRERFASEAWTAASLKHPNIVPVYDFGVEDDVLYLVMEYVESFTLAEHLSRLLVHRRLADPRILQCVQDVAAALDYAHAAGVIHRDLKPSNVLIRTLEVQALLTDFGIAQARSAPRLTIIGRSLETHAYMSPEQRAGAKVLTSAGDVYAFAAMLYEIANGEPPFGRESTTIAGHVDMPAPPLRMTAPDVSAELGAVLARGLARDPAERPRSAGELAAAFLGVVAGRPGAEPEPGPESEPEPEGEGGSDDTVRGTAFGLRPTPPRPASDPQPTPFRPASGSKSTSPHLAFGSQETSARPAPGSHWTPPPIGAPEVEVEAPRRPPRPPRGRAMAAVGAQMAAMGAQVATVGSQLGAPVGARVVGAVGAARRSLRLPRGTVLAAMAAVAAAMLLAGGVLFGVSRVLLRTSAPAPRATASAPVSASSLPKPVRGVVGSQLTVGGQRLTVENVNRDAQPPPSLQLPGGDRYVAVQVSYQAIGGPSIVSPYDWVLTDSSGAGYEPVQEGLGGALGELELAPGRSAGGLIGFDVPRDATGLVLNFDAEVGYASAQVPLT